MNNAKFVQFLASNNIEAVKESNGTYTIFCPNIPDERLKNQLKDFLPNVSVEYVIDVKVNTKRTIKAFLSNAGVVNGRVSINPHNRHVDIHAEESMEEPDWDGICKALLDDGFAKTWALHLAMEKKDYVVASKVPITSTNLDKPKRTKDITDEDMNDLHIMLEGLSVEEFIERM